MIKDSQILFRNRNVDAWLHAKTFLSEKADWCVSVGPTRVFKVELEIVQGGES